jgi:hypothetical protein
LQELDAAKELMEITHHLPRLSFRAAPDETTAPQHSPTSPAFPPPGASKWATLEASSNA